MILKSFLTVFWHDKRALGWQLLVFIAGIAAFSIVWFFSSWPVDIAYNAVTKMYTFTGLAATTVTLIRGLIQLLPAIGLFLLLIWLWVNANRNGGNQF